MSVELYYNIETFDSEQYGEQSIKRESRISWFNIVPDRPKSINFDYQAYQLNDKTDLFQFGAKSSLFHRPV